MAFSDALPSPPPLAALLERGPVALFVDFDGTLVEIASGPDAISVPGALGKALEDLAARLGGALALVSGRSIDNLTGFLGRLKLHLAGSHGGHIIHASGEILQEAQPLPEDVRGTLDDFARREGLVHERKPHGGALHYRAKPELEDRVRGFARELAASNGLATKHGKCVVELVRPGVDKGGAVRLLVQSEPFVGAMPIFIGDDITDEDGFATCEEFGGFGILVGNRDNTAARYRLANVAEVHQWLKL